MTKDQQAAPIKRSKRRIWLAAVSVTALALGFYFWLVWNSGPSFQNKPLRYWYQQLPVTVVPTITNWGPDIMIRPTQLVVGHQVRRPIREKPDDAVRAIRAMGTNALPFLIIKLQSGDSTFRSRLQRWASKVGIKARFVDDPEVERGRAVTGLLYLRPLPENALAELRRLNTNSDPAVAVSANAVLSSWGERIPAKLPTNTTTIIVQQYILWFP